MFIAQFKDQDKFKLAVQKTTVHMVTHGHLNVTFRYSDLTIVITSQTHEEDEVTIDWDKAGVKDDDYRWFLTT